MRHTEDRRIWHTEAASPIDFPENRKEKDRWAILAFRESDQRRTIYSIYHYR